MARIILNIYVTGDRATTYVFRISEDNKIVDTTLQRVITNECVTVNTQNIATTQYKHELMASKK